MGAGLFGGSGSTGAAQAYDGLYTTFAQQLGMFRTWAEAKRAILHSLSSRLEYVRSQREGAWRRAEELVAVPKLIADVRKAKSFSDLHRSDGYRWDVAGRTWVKDNPPRSLVREAERVIRQMERGR